MSWIQTYSGKRFQPLAPSRHTVSLLDIAQALGHAARWTGHTVAPYTVALHSLLVAEKVLEWGGDRDAQAAALLHDASEAYLCDVPSPLKRLPEFAPYREAEARLQRCILEAFGLPAELPEIVKQADAFLLAWEAHHPEVLGSPLPGFNVERAAWPEGDELYQRSRGSRPALAFMRRAQALEIRHVDQR